jgi:hypothetical protein
MKKTTELPLNMDLSEKKKRIGPKGMLCVRRNARGIALTALRKKLNLSECKLEEFLIDWLFIKPKISIPDYVTLRYLAQAPVSDTRQ